MVGTATRRPTAAMARGHRGARRAGHRVAERWHPGRSSSRVPALSPTGAASAASATSLATRSARGEMPAASAGRLGDPASRDSVAAAVEREPLRPLRAATPTPRRRRARPRPVRPPRDRRRGTANPPARRVLGDPRRRDLTLDGEGVGVAAAGPATFLRATRAPRRPTSAGAPRWGRPHARPMAALARRARARSGRTRMPPRPAGRAWSSRRLGRWPPGRSVRASPHSPLPAPAQIQRRARRPWPCARRGAGCPPRRPVRLGISPRATRSPLAVERGPLRPLRAAAPTPRRRRTRPRPVRSPLRPATRHGEPACPPGAGRPSPARPHPVTCPRSKARSRSAATRCPRFDYGVGAAVAQRARSPVGGADRPSSADRRSRPEDPAAPTPPREGH